MFENHRLEWKSVFVADLKKTFDAFANTDGGTVFIGIDDKGDVIGLENPDEVLQQVINTIKDNIRPDLAQFYQAFVEDRDGKNIVRVEIQRGTSRPYYLSGKGVRPEGVYVRKGSETVQASDNEILELIKTTSGNDYEKNRSFVQDLTFCEAQDFFKSRNKLLNEPEMKSLGLTGTDGLYTNLALLFSDQCPFSIKLAVFSTDQSTHEEIFVDRAEFSGSLFKQLEKSDEWLNLHNRLGATFQGLIRVDHRDYPSKALREALVNAIAHRDYSLNGPILINIFDESIEFISIGGLVKGLNFDDMMLGVSRPRNVNLSNAFIKLNLAEGWGSGIRNIKGQYKNNINQPQFLISTHAVKVVLPKLKGIKSQELTEVEIKAIDYIRKHSEIRRAELQQYLGLAQSTVINVLKSLQQKERILPYRKGRSIFYRLRD